VNQAQNYIIHTQSKVDGETYARANASYSKHAKKAQNKIIRA
jgi:hypothetical protein